MANAAPIRRVIPWLNRKEFEGVFNDIYNGSKKRQLNGVQQIDVWRSRALHKLPVAIDSTAALMRVLIDHQVAAQRNCVSEQEHSLRSLYSMALIRLVNHITEKGQTKQYARPVHIIADEFGLPEWIVDIRHSATHGHLPSLSVLETAARWSLTWLKEKFWEVQIEEVRNIEVVDDSTEKLNTILHNYQDRKLKLIQEQITQQIDLDSLDDVRKQMIPHRLISCVVEYLIPSRQQLEQLSIDVTELMTNCMGLPDMLILFWKPFLKKIDEYELSPLLLQHFVSIVTAEEILRNRLICGWLQTILKCDVRHKGNKGKRRRSNQLLRIPGNLPFNRMLQCCLNSTSLYTAPVIKLLLERQRGLMISSKISTVIRFLDLMYSTEELSSGLSQTDSDIDDSCHNVQELINEGRCERIELESNNYSTSPWQLCDDILNWEDIPIGILPHQNLCDLKLDLDLERENAVTSDSLVLGVLSQPRCFDDRDDIVMEQSSQECEQDMSDCDREESPSAMWTDGTLTDIKNKIHLLQ